MKWIGYGLAGCACVLGTLGLIFLAMVLKALGLA